MRHLEGLITVSTLKGSVTMAEKVSEHPVVLYLTFVLPIVLLALGILFDASVLQLIAVMAWLGVALMILFLPIASDNGSSQ